MDFEMFTQTEALWKAGACFRRLFNARERRVTPLGASQSLSEIFPGTGYKAFSLKGTALRGNRIARIRI